MPGERHRTNTTRLCGLVRLAQFHGEPKRGTHAFLTVDAGLSAHQFYQLAHDGQS